MPEEKFIGVVTHYFSKIGVVIVKLSAPLKVGDKVKIKRKEEEFEQEVQSMQVDHQNLQEAKKGDEVGLKVDQKVKEGWELYKIE